MFKRREPQSIIQKLREFFWPSMGWGRALSHLRHRVLRLSDTPRNIALGLAIGAGISFSPIMFTHFIQGGIIAFILRANIPAALIGTIIGNPWTFPFIWYVSLSLGSALFNLIGMPVDASPPDNVTLTGLWNMLFNDPMRLLMPWLLGGYILCISVIIMTYPIYLYLIKTANRIRAGKIENKGENNQ